MVTEGLHEGDHLALVEDRDGHAEVGQVADAALGLVDVVVEEDVPFLHLGEREVARHRVDERRVGPTGELAQLPVVDAGAEVVGIADHRGAAGPPDGRLHLHLDAGEGALDDLDEDRVDGASLGRQAPAVLVCRGQARGVGRPRRDVGRVAGQGQHLTLGLRGGGHREPSLRITRLP